MRPLLLIRLRIKEMLHKKWKNSRAKLKLTKLLTRVSRRKSKKLSRLPTREWPKFIPKKLRKLTKPPKLSKMPRKLLPRKSKPPRKKKLMPLNQQPRVLHQLLLHELGDPYG